MSHRGPDGEGWENFECGPHGIVLAHKRLAIVDLSENGAQPMGTADRQQFVTFNGEIYNHAEIRSELPSTTFRGHSDTETLLHGLSSLGEDFLPGLNGIFSFAYLDLKTKQLLLVRDPFGVKPVYYSAQPKGFCFASEVSPLERMVDTTVSEDGLVNCLKFRFSPSPTTFFKNISRLRPGHALSVDFSEETLRYREFPYIKPETRVNANRPRSFSAAVKEYGRLFERAVTRQLMSDVEVGVLLSGGIDSALVATCARRTYGRDMKAFTVGFVGSDTDAVDEIDAARQTAESIGLQHHTVRIGMDDFLADLTACVQVVEEPLATTSIVPMNALAELASQHVKVVLSGQGADEILGGYNRYQGELWNRYVPATVARIGHWIAKRLGVRNETVTRGLLAISKSDDVERFLSAYEVFSDKTIERLTGRQPKNLDREIRYFFDLLNCEQLETSVERMMAIDTRLGLSDDLLLYTDKITMRHSIECRVPILDHDLVEFVQSLPYNYRLKFGNSKLVHKAFAESILPDSIVRRKKLGFQSPTKTWFDSRSLPDRLDEMDAYSGKAILDKETIRSITDEHHQGYNRERQIFLILAILSVSSSDSFART